MLSWIREKFGTVFISIIISLIALVFIFFGVFSPRSTRGLHEGAVAGTVNGEPISITEFNRAYSRRVEYMRNLLGGKLTEDQIQAFGIKKAVFQELTRRKLMLIEAQKQGLAASDEEVKHGIQEMPVFQKDGKFDVPTYKAVLEANQYSAGGFERLIREDFSVQQWEGYFRSRVFVSDEEAKKDFLLNEEKRNIKYVLVTPEASRKDVEIKAEEIQKFLADSSKINLVKNQFEGKKETTYKGKTLDTVKDTIAREMLLGEKFAESQKAMENLAAKVMASFSAEKASDPKVNAILKPYGLAVKTTSWITRQNASIPEVGEAKELIKDAFATKSPVDPTLGGKPKKYSMAAGALIAVVTESQKPDLAKFTDEEREKRVSQLAQKKHGDVFGAWMKELEKKAKIETNDAVVGGAGEV